MSITLESVNTSEHNPGVFGVFKQSITLEFLNTSEHNPGVFKQSVLCNKTKTWNKKLKRKIPQPVN